MHADIAAVAVAHRERAEDTALVGRAAEGSSGDNPRMLWALDHEPGDEVAVRDHVPSPSAVEQASS